MDYHPGPGEGFDERAYDFGALVMGVNSQDRGARLQGQGCLGVGLGLQQGEGGFPVLAGRTHHLAVAGHVGKKGSG